MKKKLNCILLVDDDYATNLFHKMVIEDSNCAHTIIVKDRATTALDYLTTPYDEENPRPNLIILDINMPAMDGWQFLEKYKDLAPEQQAENIVLMLSATSHPDQLKRADENPLVKEYRDKPLTEEMLEEVIKKYWSHTVDA